MRGSMMRTILLAAASTAMMGSVPAPAIMPVASHKRTTVRVLNRKDKKKAARRAEHAENIAHNAGTRISKLGRRLRRKYELGRSGAF